MAKEFHFYRNTKDRCDFERESNVIDTMLDQAELSDHEEFAEHVEFDDIATQLGYGPDLPLSEDWHVGYLKSKFGGLDCYVLTHSECDFIFLRPKDIEVLNEFHGQEAMDMTDLEWKRHTQFGKPNTTSQSQGE